LITYVLLMSYVNILIERMLSFAVITAVYGLVAIFNGWGFEEVILKSIVTMGALYLVGLNGVFCSQICTGDQESEEITEYENDESSYGIDYKRRRKVDDWVRWADDIDVNLDVDYADYADRDDIEEVTLKGLNGKQKAEIQSVGMDAEDVELIHTHSDVDVLISR